jgi:hypothetical protein
MLTTESVTGAVCVAYVATAFGEREAETDTKTWQMRTVEEGTR